MRTNNLSGLIKEETGNLKHDMIASVVRHFKPYTDTKSDDFKFSLESALYYLASNNHEGQGSELYSILSTSKYKPGPIETFEKWMEDDIEGREIYDYLADKYGYEDTNSDVREDWQSKQESNEDSNLSKKDPGDSRWNNPENFTPQYESSELLIRRFVREELEKIFSKNNSKL